ncbi:hypothetical protein DOTSEDRAFT_74711 [Dothistroma septosporum NZE10]|uniref:Uncharacterized protein n=1 Tax=Dothistroma septosporum (strain NZE10 / CBS 128990) TaxID=675120 RepID=N1PC13_DOTSN|nr:hypothetical protein DOTSEDRAFT_74711 [Dothistroma septosporum NZE10]
MHVRPRRPQLRPECSPFGKNTSPTGSSPPRMAQQWSAPNSKLSKTSHGLRECILSTRPKSIVLMW